MPTGTLNTNTPIIPGPTTGVDPRIGSLAKFTLWKPAVLTKVTVSPTFTFKTDGLNPVAPTELTV